MSLFFVEHKNEIPKKKKGQVSVDTLHSLECKACPLNKAKVYSPKMEPTGSDDPDVYFLGEAPGQEEDKKAEQFVGPSGKLLRSNLKKRYIKKARFNNCIRTRPPENRDPTWIELECCRPSLVRDIEETKPKAIFGFGNVPLNWVLGEGSIGKWRGRKVPVKIGNHSCWFFPFHHPASLLRGRRKFDGNDTEFKSDYEYIFEKDIRHALGEVLVLPEPHIPDRDEIFEDIKCIDGSNGDADVKRVNRYLRRFSKMPDVAIDYETSSDEEIRETFRLVRPYGKGTKILSIGISGYDETLSFAIDHPEARWTRSQRKEVLKVFEHFMLRTKTKKIAHNLSFEMEWSVAKWGVEYLRNPNWGDTFAQAYVLDQRSGMNNLDTLILMYFGFKLKSFSSIDVSNLDKDPIEDVLKYGGADAKWEHKLYHVQKTIIINRGLSKVYDEQVRRVAPVVMKQYLGIPISQKTVKKYQVSVGDKIVKIDKKISNVPEIIKYKKKYGSFNPASTKDCTKLFRDELNIEEGKRDSATGYSSAKGSLEKLDLDIAKFVLRRRELVKLKSTYVDSVAVDGKFLWPDGLAHPTINTAFVLTRRTSSDSYNEQNWPIKKNKDVRSEIVAPDDCWFLSVDYGQIEARVIGMASKDKTFCKALWEGYDVHQEWGERIVHQYPRVIGGKRFLKDKDVMKEMRQTAKNLFVFPSFFGAQPPSISEDLKIPIDDVIKLHKDFWRTFPGVKKWQKKLKRDYREYGYIELLTGFRMYGPLDGSKIINYPIQGTASEIVIDSLNRLSEYACSTGKIGYHPRMLIHDDLSFFIKKKKFDEYVAFIIDEMLKINFNFINVPLTVELAYGPNWFDLQEIGTYRSNE